MESKALNEWNIYLKRKRAGRKERYAKSLTQTARLSPGDKTAKLFRAATAHLDECINEWTRIFTKSWEKSKTKKGDIGDVIKKRKELFSNFISEEAKVILQEIKSKHDETKIETDSNYMRQKEYFKKHISAQRERIYSKLEEMREKREREAEKKRADDDFKKKTALINRGVFAAVIIMIFLTAANLICKDTNVKTNQDINIKIDSMRKEIENNNFRIDMLFNRVNKMRDRESE